MSTLYEDPYKKAKSEGLEVLLPAEDELQLDIDTEKGYQTFLKMRETLDQNIGILEQRITESRSGNKHIILKLNRTFTAVERIALQAIMGSDNLRELLSLKNIYDGRPNPTLLFEKPMTTESGRKFR